MKANKPDISLIRKYLDGELDERAMYELERQAEADPLLMDVIKGMESADADSHRQNLASIDSLLKERIEKGKARRILPLVSWQIAASLVIALSIGGWLLTRNVEKEIVAQKPVQRERQDSSKSPLSADKNTDAAAALQKAEQSKPATYSRADLENELKANIPLASNTKNIAAKERIGLQEVTVVAYGAQKKSDLTGAVSSVNSMESGNKNLSDSNLNQSLMAKAPGAYAIRGVSGNHSYLLITGKVLDKTDNRPLPGAAVHVFGTEHATRTDANGNFSINIPESTKALNIAMIGYEHQQVKIKKGENPEIKMEPDKAGLSEVVVIGYGSQRKEIEKAHPVIGWPAYKQYLKDNAISPDGNSYRVNLEFTVDSLGVTSNFIVKGSNDTINRKAIDLVQNGPKWIAGNNGKPQTVKLRVIFQK